MYQTDFILSELQCRREHLRGEAFSLVDPVLHQDNLEDIQAYRKRGWAHPIERGKHLQDPEIYFGMLTYSRQNLRRMRESGVTTGCGMDAGLRFC